MVLIKTLGDHKAREIQARIDCQFDLWERSIHAGLVGYVLAEGRAQEGRVKRRVEEDVYSLARSFCGTLLAVMLWQTVCQATDREGVGVFSGGRLHEDRLTGCVCSLGVTP